MAVPPTTNVLPGWNLWSPSRLTNTYTFDTILVKLTTSRIMEKPRQTADGKLWVLTPQFIKQLFQHDAAAFPVFLVALAKKLATEEPLDGAGARIIMGCRGDWVLGKDGV